MPRLVKVVFVSSLVLLGCIAHGETADAEPSARRLMPFLCRDAVVRESAERRVLVDKTDPLTIVTGAPRGGILKPTDQGFMQQAAAILAKYFEKMTGVRCGISSFDAAAGVIPDGDFESPPGIVGEASTKPPFHGAVSGQWVVYHNLPGEGARVFLDEAARHGGKTSLCVEGKTHASAAVRSVIIDKEVSYRLSFWYRTANQATPFVMVTLSPTERPKEDLPAAGNWTLHQMLLPPREAATQATVFLGLGDTQSKDARVWFDDVSLLRADASTERAWGNRIFLGTPEADPTKLFPELGKADAHGFLIAARKDGLHIVGASSLGTLYGAWFFLYNYAGLRIVMPGEIGEVYDKVESLTIPRDLYVFNPGPDFLLRIWSQGDFDQGLWLQDTGSTPRFDYHHAFVNSVPPGKYGKTNPELYPVWSGKRVIPANMRAGWQPTFSEPSLVEKVIDYANGQFTWKPDLKSISVTVNDGSSHSELDLKDGVKGLREIYYSFVNKVAKGISEKWPDKVVAFLPYAEVAEPPSFPLEDNVMMFIFSQEGNPQEVYQKWQGKVKNFGIYQWLYGAGYVIPNHWPHAMQEYLGWLRSIGGKAFKGEAIVAWAQGGAKMWVLSNLLWNTDADVDALLRDYYEHCYGKEAAPAVARYFAQAEQIYERRREPNRFNLVRLEAGASQFAFAKEEDFVLMEKSLAEANRLVKGEGNRTRLDWTTRCFRLGRIYWNTHKALQRFETAAAAGARSEDNVKEMCDAGATFYRSLDQCDEISKTQITPVPIGYCIAGNFRDKPPTPFWYWVDGGFRWETKVDFVVAEFGKVTAEKRKQQSAEEVAAYWEQVGARYPELSGFANHQRWLLLHRESPLKNFLSNGSFEEPPAPADPEQAKLLSALKDKVVFYIDWNDYEVSDWCCKDWATFHRNNKDFTAGQDGELAKEGARCARLSGQAFYGGIMHDVHAPSPRARYRLSFWYRTGGEFRTGFFGVAFYPTPGLTHIVKGFGASGNWSKRELEFMVNCRPEDARFTIALGAQRPTSDNCQVWFDDVRLEMLSPEGVSGR